MPTYKYTPRRNTTNNIVPKPETTENKQVENNLVENNQRKYCYKKRD